MRDRHFQRLIAAVRLDLSLHIRGARSGDIPELVELDIKEFASVYRYGDRSPQELRAHVSAMMAVRQKLLGRRWIRVLRTADQLVGCVVACPTSKPPESFMSWEDTTDDGFLGTTYDTNGRYLYVVSFAANAKVSARHAGDMLMLNMIGRIIGGGYSAYFESRVPGLRRWVINQCRHDGTELENLSAEQLDRYAERYLAAEIVVNEVRVPLDPLLRTYKSVGCSFLRIVAGAYQDNLSLDYGVVCQYDNPLPSWAQRIPPVRSAAGLAIRFLSHSNLLVRRFLQESP